MQWMLLRGSCVRFTILSGHWNGHQNRRRAKNPPAPVKQESWRPTLVGPKKSYREINRRNHIAACDMTFSPHNPQKNISQAAICFFSREAHICHVSKVPPSHYLFYKIECNNAMHNATTHKTKRNNTQDQRQQHTPLLNYGECFHVDVTSELRKRLLLHDAGTNQCHRQTEKQMRQVVLDRAGPAIGKIMLNKIFEYLRTYIVI
jgi:AAA+ ATPase superfamily predicted ATPase